MPRLVTILLLCLTLLSLRMDSQASTPAPRHPALAQFPTDILWAWERPEDLRWLPPDVGVAYVAATILLRGDEALLHQRGAPLRLASGTPTIPVLHVDASSRIPPTLSNEQSARITQALLRIAQRATHNVVQLDFEVRRSQRPFLAATIAAIRARLDPRIALSVTALASWCLDDYWMQDSRADEIVPMAFRMGNDEHKLRQRLLDQQGFTRAGCQSAIGFASDEPIMAVRASRQYYFSPTPWTAARWQALRSTARSSIHTSQ